MSTTASAKREAEVYARAAHAAARSIVNEWASGDDGTTPIVDLEAPARAAKKSAEAGLLWRVDATVVAAARAAARNLPSATVESDAARAMLAHEGWLVVYEVWRAIARP